MMATRKYQCGNLSFFLPVLILFITMTAAAQHQSAGSWNNLASSNPLPTEIKLLSSDIETTKLEMITAGFWKENVRIVNGIPEIKVFTENTTPMLVKGAPDLEKLTVSVIIPDRARMVVSITEEEFIDIPGIHIVPSKGNLMRDINPEDVPFEYGREYLTDAFYPGVTAELRTPHIIRDVRGQVVVIYPFRYNPVRKTLRFYTRLVVEVKTAGEDGENVLNIRREEGKTVRGFEGIYQRNFLNYDAFRSASRYIPLEEDGNMLIISYGSFMNDMQDFIDWKNMSGIPTEIVNVSSIGTTAAQIKSYVANYYNTTGLTYLLLVGDAAQVPTSSTTAGHSDNNYSYIVGNDHYPDIFVGRFSAENNAHVQTQVLRTLNYEMQPDLAPGYYQRAMGIASAEGPGDDGEYDWQHQRNIRTDYMGFTYTYGAELYDGSQGGQDATGNPTPAMVSNEINTGTGIISYTGHGSNTSWGTTGFSNTNVAGLTNTNKLPFILSVACVNGNFVGYTCFAEAWLRATYNGQPSGAVATIMSTINQSWNPPMQGQDEMVDILVESYATNIKRTFGGICMNGCMNMNDVYGSGGADMTDTWTIFGDPSLMVRTAAPAAMTVTHLGDLPVGASQLTVYCDQEGARVAVSHDNYQLLGTAIISGGSAEITFGQINTLDTLTVTVTAFNCRPSIDTVFVTNSEMSYVSCTSFHSNLEDAGPGELNTEVLGIKVMMSGSLDPVDLVSLTVNMNGTTSLADVDGLKVFYTGNSSTFAATNLFGTAGVASGSITITGDQALAGGYNHFWLAYDLNPSAVTGNYIDAQCTQVHFSGYQGVQVPAITSPAGYRLVQLNYCIPAYIYGTGDGDYISLVSLNTMTKTSSYLPAPYYIFYQDVTTHLATGLTYQLTVSPGTYGSGNNIAAWIDFNRDGTFSTTEKLGEVSVAPMPATATITFQVPVTAYTGLVRMRVREVWSNTGIDPCINYGYGETEDYNIHIMPPSCWLGYSGQWNNASNWSDGIVPGPGSQVIIPEILMGNYYPCEFVGNQVIEQLHLEDGSNISIPEGVTITVTGGQ
jgi:hypothetical protein